VCSVYKVRHGCASIATSKRPIVLCYNISHDSMVMFLSLLVGSWGATGSGGRSDLRSAGDRELDRGVKWFCLAEEASVPRSSS
jgi:hypothetical protein